MYNGERPSRCSLTSAGSTESKWKREKRKGKLFWLLLSSSILKFRHRVLQPPLLSFRKEIKQATQLELEAEMAARIAAKVKERVEAAMDSEEVQKTIETRLIEERAKLEEKVPALSYFVYSISQKFLCNSHKCSFCDRNKPVHLFKLLMKKRHLQ